MAADWHMRRDDRRALVEVSGELDLANGEALRQAIETELVADHADTVVIDVRHLSFLDSSGINALLRLRRTLDEDGTRIELNVEADSIVERVLHVAGLTDVLGVRLHGTSPETAVAD
jgi:anti-sigma B factor antagonist